MHQSHTRQFLEQLVRQLIRRGTACGAGKIRPGLASGSHLLPSTAKGVKMSKDREELKISGFPWRLTSRLCRKRLHSKINRNAIAKRLRLDSAKSSISRNLMSWQ